MLHFGPDNKPCELRPALGNGSIRKTLSPHRTLLEFVKRFWGEFGFRNAEGNGLGRSLPVSQIKWPAAR